MNIKSSINLIRGILYLHEIIRCKSSGIYSQFENLYKTMDLYAITESLSHIRQAYKCFEKTVDRELRSRQR